MAKKKSTWKNKWFNLIERAAWTFLQAGFAVLAVSDEPFSKAALIAAFAAGVSAIKTFVKETI